MIRKWSLLFCILPFFAIAAIAQEGDIPDSQDHPLISRYPGSVITGYHVATFDNFTLPTNGEAGGAASGSEHR